jgi:membrane protein DedA with SNARE-associated domain
MKGLLRFRQTKKYGRLSNRLLWQDGGLLFEELLTTYGYLGVFVVSLGVNLIPFSSPSNLVIAGATTFLLPQMNPLFVGLVVAVAASAAKTGHYYVAAYLGGKCSMTVSHFKTLPLQRTPALNCSRNTSMNRRFASMSK